MADKKMLYVVHCIDTESPLNESLSATFERLQSILTLSLLLLEKICSVSGAEFSAAPISDEISRIVPRGACARHL